MGSFIKDRPRLVAAAAFGLSTAVLVHFSWYPEARMNGIAPAISVGSGLAHALAGTLTGPRLISRRLGFREAGLLGAITSLIALAFFAVAFTMYVSVADGLKTTSLGYLLLNLYTALFAFLAAGWSLLLLCVGVGWALNRIAYFHNPA